MLRKIFLVLLVVAMSLVATLPVLADAPPTGPVVEGESVPGVALGFTRAQVEAAYGDSFWCQSGSTPGDQASCSFPVAGGGRVVVRFAGPGGGGPGASPDDVATSIQWSEQVSGWVTTAGINTALAKADPHAVLEAYPNGVVTYNYWGTIWNVTDYEGGIRVEWNPDFYAGTVNVFMSIFAPRPAPPPPPPVEQRTYVSDIELTASKTKGQRKVVALVQVRNHYHLAAVDANVVASWTFPNGDTQAVQGVTSSSGYAYFEINDASRGDYTVTIDDVVLDGHRFDKDQSVLSASIMVK